MQIARRTVSDDPGQLNVVWFNQPDIANHIREGDQICRAGEVDVNGGLVMKNPEYEKVSSDPSHAARIVPIYPETRGLTSRWLRPKIRPLLWLADQLDEVLPAEILARRGFMPRAAAVKQVHFPESMEALETTCDGFEFEENLLSQIP